MRIGTEQSNASGQTTNSFGSGLLDFFTGGVLSTLSSCEGNCWLSHAFDSTAREQCILACTQAENPQQTTSSMQSINPLILIGGGALALYLILK